MAFIKKIMGSNPKQKIFMLVFFQLNYFIRINKVSQNNGVRFFDIFLKNIIRLFSQSGVARAVEELIQEGMMTRENAIKFLHDIRLGIEYLENTYSSDFTVSMKIILRP